MRLLLRFVVVGAVIGSCVGDLYPPPTFEPCVMVPDTVFQLGADSTRLPVGAVYGLYVNWGVASCNGFETFSLSEVEWIERDTSIAAYVDAPQQYRRILGSRPGRTVLSARARQFQDSVIVIVPDTVPMGRVTFVAAGGDISCAVDVADVGRCWGGSGYLFGNHTESMAGECLGNNFCSPMPVPRATGAESVFISSQHACVLDGSGAASCWGQNSSGQVVSVSGGQVTNDPTPVGGGLSFSTLTLGPSHTCGLDGAGAAYCWGSTRFGALGTTATTPQVRPVSGGHRFVSIAARADATCGVTGLGAILCWGYLGQTDVSIPGAETCTEEYAKGPPTQVRCAMTPLRIPLATPLPADTTFASVSGRCALTTLGSVYCYEETAGRFRGLAGVGPFTSLAGHDSHHCGLDPSGAGSCWGSNEAGQLGDGTIVSRSVPVAISGGHLFLQLAVGAAHSCGLRVAGDVWCWGSNTAGQVGVPMLDERIGAPRRVRGQG